MKRFILIERQRQRSRMGGNDSINLVATFYVAMILFEHFSCHEHGEFNNLIFFLQRLQFYSVILGRYAAYFIEGRGRRRRVRL